MAATQVPRGLWRVMTSSASPSVVNPCVFQQSESPSRFSGAETEVDIFEVEEIAFIKSTDLTPALEVEGHGRSAEGLWRLWSRSERSNTATLERDLDAGLLNGLLLPVEDDGPGDPDSRLGDGVGQHRESPRGEGDVVVTEQGDGMPCRLCHPQALVGTCCEATVRGDSNVMALGRRYLADDIELAGTVEGRQERREIGGVRCGRNNQRGGKRA